MHLRHNLSGVLQELWHCSAQSHPRPTGISALIYRARHDIPFSWIFLAFGVFIFSCSVTHFMEVWTIWHATYWLSGYVKLLTAAASVATAVVLPFLVPKVLMLIKAVKLSEERRAQLERVGGNR